MRHLKTYEVRLVYDKDREIYNNNKAHTDYNIGEYVFVDLSNYEKVGGIDYSKNNIIGKIIDYTLSKQYPYNIILPNGDNFWASDSEITDGHPSTKECEEFEIILTTLKYNM